MYSDLLQAGDKHVKSLILNILANSCTLELIRLFWRSEVIAIGKPNILQMFSINAPVNWVEDHLSFAGTNTQYPVLTSIKVKTAGYCLNVLFKIK